MANTMLSGFMERTASGDTVPDDRPMRTSAPASASSNVPTRFERLLISANIRFSEFRSSRPRCTIPLLSATARSPMPASRTMRETAMPAAPAPLTTARRSPSDRPVRRAALRSAASTTMAVPCWSSWNTGMSSRACSRRSTSKQRGALMSSRLMPPNAGAIRTTVSTSSSTSVTSRQIGTASTPPNCLNSSALPSMTGRAAVGPMSPRPSTAVPSVTTATVCDFQV